MIDQDFDKILIKSLKQEANQIYFEDCFKLNNCSIHEYITGLINSFNRFYDSFKEKDFTRALLTKPNGDKREVNLNIEDGIDQINEIIQEGEILSYPYYNAINEFKTTSFKYGSKITAKRLQALWPSLNEYFLSLTPFLDKPIPFDKLNWEFPISLEYRKKIPLNTKDLIESGFFKDLLYIYIESGLHGTEICDKDRLMYVLCHSEEEKQKVTLKEIKKINKRIKQIGHEEYSLCYLEEHRVDSPHYIDDNVRGYDYWIDLIYEQFLFDYDPDECPQLSEIFDLSDKEGRELLDQIIANVLTHKETRDWNIDLDYYSQHIDSQPIIREIFEYCELFVLLERLEMFKSFLIEEQKNQIEMLQSPEIENIEKEIQPVVIQVNSFALMEFYEIVSSINNAFYRLECFMNSKLNDYHYFGFNDAFTIFFEELKKPKNYTFKNCKLAGKYWELTEQLRIDFDQSNFENEDAFENDNFCKDSDEINFLNNDRIEEFSEFQTPDEIGESEHKYSILDILKDEALIPKQLISDYTSQKTENRTTLTKIKISPPSLPRCRADP